jgi:hypothetical protein
MLRGRVGLVLLVFAGVTRTEAERVSRTSRFVAFETAAHRVRRAWGALRVAVLSAAGGFPRRVSIFNTQEDLEPRRRTESGR